MGPLNVKDSNDFLFHLEQTKDIALSENWNWDDMIVFSIDVKALYPSVNFEFLEKAINNAFDTCTAWSTEVKDTLVALILHTLKRQQVRWNGFYYMLNRGIPTGSKHAVPLANIFLTFIILDALSTDDNLRRSFDVQVKLWKRYIDDCSGIFHGNITEFMSFFRSLQAAFSKYGLELTCETDSYSVSDGCTTVKSDQFSTFLDMELFKTENTLHSREHRKETSANCYLPIRSAHPRHCFPGIIKSQLFRLRRICSQDVDFIVAVERLRNRCLNSGYNQDIVNEILNQATTMERVLSSKREKIVSDDASNVHAVRLVVLTGTPYEQEFVQFAKRLNPIIEPNGMKIEIVSSTSLPIGRMLFNNNEKHTTTQSFK